MDEEVNLRLVSEIRIKDWEETEGDDFRVKTVGLYEGNFFQNLHRKTEILRIEKSGVECLILKSVATHWRQKRKSFMLKACSINFNSEEYRQELHCKQKLSLCAVSYGGPEEDKSLSR